MDVHLAERPAAAKDAEIGRDGGCVQRGRAARPESGQRRGDEVHAARQECCTYDFRHGRAALLLRCAEPSGGGGVQRSSLCVCQELAG